MVGNEPQVIVNNYKNGGSEVSLRDEIAMRAFEHLLVDRFTTLEIAETLSQASTRIASTAYTYADAMMKERSKVE